MAKSKKDKKKGISFFTKGSNDYIIWIVVIMLLALGLIMVLSASSATSLAESGDSYKYFKKQLLAASVGIVGMIILSRIDYKIYKRFAVPIYIVIVGLLFAVKFVGMESRTELKDG